MRIALAHFFLLMLALSVPACLIVDSGPLDRARERADGGGMTDDVPADDAPTSDAGPGGVETCGDPSSPLLVGTGIFNVDTRSMANDFAIMGTSMPGNDAFFQFSGVSGEFWHFHLAGVSPDRNPILYVVQASGGICSSAATAVRNACDMSDGDEHFAFRPPSTGTFFLGIDDGSAGGGVYRLQVIRPVCGNGLQEHGEPCDGDDGAEDTCTDDCRIRLSDISGTGQTTVPPGRHNDTAIEAMLIELDGGVLDINGSILPGDCYPDVFSIAVAAGQTVSVTARNATTMAACAAASEATYSLELQNATGIRIAGGVDGNGCPVINQVLATAGVYYVRLDSTADGERTVNYTLEVEVTP
jgi:hypothetical protein